MTLMVWRRLAARDSWTASWGRKEIPTPTSTSLRMASGLRISMMAPGETPASAKRSSTILREMESA